MNSILQHVKKGTGLLIAIFLISASALSDQASGQIFFEEDFESTAGDGETIIEDDLPDWINFNLAGPLDWYSNSEDGVKFAEITSTGVEGIHITWLVTPEIEIQDGGGYLSFDMSVGTFRDTNMEILYAPDFDGENFSDASWGEISDLPYIPEGPEDGFSDFETITIPIPEVVTEAHFAFVSGTDGDGDVQTTYRISNVRVQGTPTSTDPAEDVPHEVVLDQNYPNPFNPTTQISYELPEAADVHLEVFNALGQRMAVLVNEHQQAGRHSVTFDAEGMASGVYIYRMVADGVVFTNKMTLIK